MNENESLDFLRTKINELKKIKTLNDFDFSKIYPVLLFHGTDKRILSLSNDEINKARNYNMLAFRTLHRLLLENNFNPFDKGYSPSSPFDPEKEEKLHKKKEFFDKCNALFGEKTFDKIIKVFQNDNLILQGKSNLWQYNNLYTTPGTRIAYDYASRSAWFGELGYHTHCLYIAAKGINLDFSKLPEEEKEAVNFVDSIFNNSPEPIIFYLENINIDEIAEVNQSKTGTLSTSGTFEVLSKIDLHTLPYLELSEKNALEIDEEFENIYSDITRSSYSSIIQKYRDKLKK